MSTLPPPKVSEKFFGSPVLQGALALGDPVSKAVLADPTLLACLPFLLPVLPVIANTIACERFQKRIEQAFNELKVYVEEKNEAFQNLTDSQFKLINEAVLTLLQTVDDQKIEYLKKVVKGVVSQQDILPQEAAMLSRVLRDISAEEVDFLVRNFTYKRVLIGHPTSSNKSEDITLWIEPDSNQALIVRGLVSLGMLSGVDVTFDYKDTDCFSRITAKLMAILDVKRT